MMKKKFEPWEVDFSDSAQRLWRKSDSDNTEFDPLRAEEFLMKLATGVDERIGVVLNSGCKDLCKTMSGVTIRVSLQVYAILVNLSMLGLKRVEEIETDMEEFDEIFGCIKIPELDI